VGGFDHEGMPQGLKRLICIEKILRCQQRTSALEKAPGRACGVELSGSGELF
jgi:hypothetical protein